jgi:hypothetical protein
MERENLQSVLLRVVVLSESSVEVVEESVAVLVLFDVAVRVAEEVVVTPPINWNREL